MLKYISLLPVAALSFAADLTITGPRIARPGQTVVYTVNGTGVGSAFQVDFAPGTEKATVITGKRQDCGVVAGKRRCVVYGADNATPIPDGAVLTFEYTAPAAVGVVVVQLTAALGSSPTGQPITITLPAPFGLLVTRVDVNSDGKIDTLDTLATAAAVVTNTCTPNTDINVDGKCDVVDVQIVANGAAENLAVASKVAK